MKRLLLLLVVLCVSGIALAQVRDVGPRHEVRLGLGALAKHSATSGYYYLAFDERNASFGDRYLYSKVSQGTITQTPSFNLSYTYRVKSWFEVGALLSYDCIYSPTYYYKTGEKIGSLQGHGLNISPTIRFVWVRRDMVRMYTAFNLGVGWRIDAHNPTRRPVDGAFIPRKTSAIFNSDFAYGATLLGITVGRQLFGFAELGLASHGFFVCGIGYRIFTPKQRGHETK